MRAAFMRALEGIAARDESLFVLAADTGFHVFDDFQRRYPDRYLNPGICEAATMGLAAGLALEGRRVFVYGIANFVALRPYEHIRNDLCLHRLPVTIVGVGQGLTYAAEGATHHSIDDISALAAMPGMTVCCPGDPYETEEITKASVDLDGPLYLRIGKSGEPTVHGGSPPPIQIGRGAVLHRGEKIAIAATGNMLPTAVAARELLAVKGVDATLVSMHTVKPFDADLVAELARDHEIVATVEEHVAHGGLGAATARVIAEQGGPARLRLFSTPDAFVERAASHEAMRRHAGLEPEHIATALLADLGRS
jgi:transketolase